MPTLILLSYLQTQREKSALFSREKVVEKAGLRERGQWKAPEFSFVLYYFLRQELRYPRLASVFEK